MKKALFVLFLIISTYARVFGFPTLSSDSWNTEVQANKTVYTSQTAIGYDPIHDRLWSFNGHPPVGGYPQPDDMMAFDLNSKTWTDVRPKNSSTPPAS